MVTFKSLREAFRLDYPVSEPPSQTDLLIFQLIRIQSGSPVADPPVAVPVSSSLKLISPVEGTEAIAGIPLEIFATSSLPRTIGKVEFFVGTTKIGEDRSLPYSVSFTPSTLGALALRAVAISPDGATQVSSEIVNITVVAAPTPPNQPPIVSLANPGSVTAGSTITLTATASDPDGTINKVEFYAGTTKLGEDTSSPYTQSWTPVAGSYVLTAVAIDDKGLATTSTARNVTVTPSGGGGGPVSSFSNEFSAEFGV